MLSCGELRNFFCRIFLFKLIVNDLANIKVFLIDESFFLKHLNQFTIVFIKIIYKNMFTRKIISLLRILKNNI